MKNLLRIIIVVVVLSGLSLIVSEMFPRYQLSVLDSKWSWIETQIYERNRRPVDYLIVGSSGIWTALDPLIMEQTAGTHTRVLNFGRNWVGRDVDYITLKHTLQNRRVKNLILEFSMEEVIGHHSYMRHFASIDDVLQEIQYLQRDSQKPQPQSELSLKFQWRTISQMLGDIAVRVPRVWMGRAVAWLQNRDGSRDRVQQEYHQARGFYFPDIAQQQDPAFLQQYKRMQPPKTLPRFSGHGIEGTLADFYLRRMVALAEAYDTKVYFTYLPQFRQGYPSPEALQYFSRLGLALIPELESLYQIDYWRDERHLTAAGAQVFSEKMLRGLLCLYDNHQLKTIP